MRTSDEMFWFCNECGEGFAITSFNPKQQMIIYGESEEG